MRKREERKSNVEDELVEMSDGVVKRGQNVLKKGVCNGVKSAVGVIAWP
jgi:hypothetical protein